MQQSPLKKFTIKPLVLTIALSVLILFGSSFRVLLAQNNNQAPESTPANSEEDVICQTEMGKYIEEQQKLYLDFMENHFTNKSSTASLINDAIGRYREYRQTLFDKLATFFPNPDRFLEGEGLSPGACYLQVKQALTEARRLIQSKAERTSAVKKTTALIEKYQQINGKLRNMQQNFMTMKAYITTFADKLPCYIKKSCNKK